MLRSLRVGNHRSFRTEQELLLMPFYDKENLVVPVAAIYGANASGKSNLIDGLRFMASAVRDSFARWDPDGGVPRRPFRLELAARDEPSVFVVELVLESVRYTYGFVVDDERVNEEWLYSYPEKRRRILFERAGGELKFGSTVPELQTKLELLVGLLRPNALFLSLAGQSKLDVLAPVYRWFSNGIVFLEHGNGSVEHDVARAVRSQPALRKRMVELLRVADLGISDLTIEDNAIEQARHRLAEAEYELHSVEVERDRLVQHWADADDQRQAELEPRMAQLGYRRDDALRRQAVARNLLEIARKGSDRVRLLHGDAGEAFDLAEESDGTRSWLAILPTVLATLDVGGTLVVDEIDTSLHPVLVLRLVKLFRDKQTNPGGAQLIFTTHDATLLHPPLAEEGLGRDEIWFVEKDRSGASTLYPLTDFKPRAEDNVERRYLSGRYGAIPNVVEEDFIAAIRGTFDVEA